MCSNLLVRSLCGALVLLPLVALTGHAQAPSVPTGEARMSGRILTSSEYRIRVDEPQRWTVKAVRRRGMRITRDRLVIRNAEILDELEILIGPR